MSLVEVTVTYTSELRRSYDVEIEDGPDVEERTQEIVSGWRQSGVEADGWDESIPSVSVEVKG